MLTPAISSEIAKSSDVSSRAQPPFWIRFGEMLNEDQKNGWVLTSVAGGSLCEGNWLSMTSLRGPSSRKLSGLSAVFTRPCGGKSGLPKLGVGWFGTPGAALVRLPGCILAALGKARRMSARRLLKERCYAVELALSPPVTS
jgi:hypothetical protein